MILYSMFKNRNMLTVKYCANCSEPIIKECLSVGTPDNSTRFYFCNHWCLEDFDFPFDTMCDAEHSRVDISEILTLEQQETYYDTSPADFAVTGIRYIFFNH